MLIFVRYHRSFGPDGPQDDRVVILNEGPQDDNFVILSEAKNL